MNQSFEVKVTKLTDESLMIDACEMTFAGKSKQSLLSMYKSEHSPARTQMFWIKCLNIPLYISTHLLRHHVGSQPYQLTCRTDRKGGNVGFVERTSELIDGLKSSLLGAQNGDYDWLPENLEEYIKELEWLRANADRHTPVNLGILVNAQSLIDMAKLRECFQASAGTREVFAAIKEKVAEIDPELAILMVKKCVYRNGLCGEPKCCGYNTTKPFQKELEEYKSNFSAKQIGALV